MTDYERIATVIRHIHARHGAEPCLDQLAALVGMGPSRFRKMFAEWAGFAPKDVVRYLSLNLAHEVLCDAESGLSARGHSRVSLAAASPDESKSGGAGWTISAGIADSPFGACLLAVCPRGICHLSFAEEWGRLETGWPNAVIVRDDHAAARWARAIFPRAGCERALNLYVRGTAFQVKVWRALLEVPAGRVVSYGHLARRIGRPRSSRAVGAAVGANPIGFLVPCHRVTRASGALGGYRWGAERKHALLAWEHGAGGAA